MAWAILKIGSIFHDTNEYHFQAFLVLHLSLKFLTQYVIANRLFLFLDDVAYFAVQKAWDRDTGVTPP